MPEMADIGDEGVGVVGHVHAEEGGFVFDRVWGGHDLTRDMETSREGKRQLEETEGKRGSSS